MFADFVEFEYRGRIVSYNRLFITDIHLYNPHIGWHEAAQLPPLNSRTHVLITVSGYQPDGGMSFGFATEEEAKRIYDLIKLGNNT